MEREFSAFALIAAFDTLPPNEGGDFILECETAFLESLQNFVGRGRFLGLDAVDFVIDLLIARCKAPEFVVGFYQALDVLDFLRKLVTQFMWNPHHDKALRFLRPPQN